MLGEALKTNKTLTTLDLSGDEQGTNEKKKKKVIE